MSFLRICKPYAVFNNRLNMSLRQQDIYYNVGENFCGKTFIDKNIEGHANDLETRFYAEFLTSSFVYVITETVCEYPYPYFSEKTWKAINTGCPFMMVNAQNSLAKLKQFGFKTFSDWWDESYDTLQHGGDRIEAMVLEIKKLSALSVAELTQLRQEIYPVLEYNLKHLKIFYQQNLDNLLKSI